MSSAATAKNAKTIGFICGSLRAESINKRLEKALIKEFKRAGLKTTSINLGSYEYNGGLPPVLKNAIDWTSTVGTAHFSSPYWGISSCTPGPMSGIMCMRQINYILMRVGGHVSPIQVGVGHAGRAFDDKGELTAEPSLTLAQKLIADMQAHI